MNKHLQTAVDLLGSQSALARAIGCTPQHVSMMILGQRRVSAETAVRIQAATNGHVTMADLRPDLPAARPAASPSGGSA